LIDREVSGLSETQQTFSTIGSAPSQGVLCGLQKLKPRPAGVENGPYGDTAVTVTEVVIMRPPTPHMPSPLPDTLLYGSSAPCSPE